MIDSLTRPRVTLSVVSGEDAQAAGKPIGGDKACRPALAAADADAPRGLSRTAPPKPPRAWRGGLAARRIRADGGSAPPSRAASALTRLAGRARGDLAVAIGAPLLAGLLLPPQAWLFARLIHGAPIGASHDGLSDLAPITPFIIVGGLIAVRALLVWCGEMFGSRAAQRIVGGLQTAMVHDMLRQPPSWTAARASGALAGGIVDQAASLDGYFGRYLPALTAAAVLPIVFALTASLVAPVVGLLFCVTAPLIVVFMALVGMGAETASRRHQHAFLRLSGLFADRLRGLTTLKLLGRVEGEAERLRQAGDELRARTLAVLRIAFLSSAVLEFFAALGVAGAALYVGLAFLGLLPLQTAPLSLEAGLLCLLLAPEVYLPLRQFAACYHDRAAAKAAVASLVEQFGALPRLDGQPADAAPAVARHTPLSLVVRGLTLKTPDGSQTILADAALAVAAGTHVAVVGASGVGKSSFLEAIGRLRAHDGRIELGGLPLDAMPEPAFRAHVALLGQRPRLFEGTIEDNIRMGCACDGEAVLAAAARAGVMRFAAALPLGLATPVGEGGLGLSGGEAHRVALARIFLRDPDLILLDEPTAHLDAATEEAVLDGILDFAAGRTLIVATHSKIVAERMDRVLRIEGRAIFATPIRRRMSPPPALGEALA